MPSGAIWSAPARSSCRSSTPFEDEPQEVPKYVCAPCSNCKGAIRDIIGYYHAEERSHLYYGGLVELIVNAMAGMKKPIIQFRRETVMGMIKDK
ncbi:MAG: hypothetical protein MZV70_72320 [Desulfobacterales bacterium]|nr:hypothetical protein [Desulfobacterales bacterium]